MDPTADRGVSVLSGIVLPPRYEPIRRIAQGGMATVWCAQDRTLDRRVAIKLLAEPFAHDDLAGRRFKREARAAARLSGHPNVVTIYDVGQTPPDDESAGRPFLVMEFLSGGTVADALRVGAVEAPTALLWLQQAAAALDHAHRRGVIHRDVKPANFLLDRDRVLHVADFGIAQLGTEETLTTSGQVLGTAAYLAPERALGLPATEASDRYALAVAAFELLVGERPFTAEHFAAQARQHLEEPPPLASRRNAALPPSLDAVLVRGLAKRPEERFATTLELTDAIEDALAHKPRGRWGDTTAPTRPLITARPAHRSPGPAPAPRDGSARRPRTGGGLAPPSRAGLARPTRARIATLAALSLVLLGVAVAAATSGGDGARGRTLAAKSHVSAKRTSRSRATHRAAAAADTAGTTAAPAPGGSASQLEAQGHALMLAGSYQGAIPVLRQAVAAAASGSLTYAYALFDLGRSLRLAGDPRAAVPILRRRLQIPNQTPVVRAELALALSALGERAAAPGPGDHHGGGRGD